MGTGQQSCQTGSGMRVVSEVGRQVDGGRSESREDFRYSAETTETEAETLGEFRYRESFGRRSIV